MIKLIDYFNTDTGRVLSENLFELRKKYLDEKYIKNDENSFFDGTQAKGYIAEITLYHKKDVTPADSDAIREIYSFFVG